MGHSTGGLITTLWTARRPDRVDGLVLNSPWLDLQGSALVRTLGTPVIDAIGSRAPTSVIRLPDLGFYARTLHRIHGGEWDYDLELKSSPSPPVRVGWLRAVLLGHQRVAAGLAGWGVRRRDGTGRLLVVAFGTAALALTAYGLWHGGFPAPSELP